MGEIIITKEQRADGKFDVTLYDLFWGNTKAIAVEAATPEEVSAMLSERFDIPEDDITIF